MSTTTDYTKFDAKASIERDGAMAGSGEAVRRLRQCRAALATWLQRSRDRRALAKMSDRELADIGVCRASVDTEIDKSFWRS